MATPTLTRRTVLNTVALATTALAMPFVRGAHAAGKLSCGFWYDWVPGANEPLAKLCREWADREKVELTIDFITSQGDKLALTATAEAQARSGHDVLQMADWYVAAQAENLGWSTSWSHLCSRSTASCCSAPNTSASRRAAGLRCRPGFKPRGRPHAPHRPLQAVVGPDSPKCNRLAHPRTRSSPKPGRGTGFLRRRRSARGRVPFACR